MSGLACSVYKSHQFRTVINAIYSSPVLPRNVRCKEQIQLDFVYANSIASTVWMNRKWFSWFHDIWWYTCNLVLNLAFAMWIQRPVMRNWYMARCLSVSNLNSICLKWYYHYEYCEHVNTPVEVGKWIFESF